MSSDSSFAQEKPAILLRVFVYLCVHVCVHLQVSAVCVYVSTLMSTFVKSKNLLLLEAESRLNKQTNLYSIVPAIGLLPHL